MRTLLVVGSIAIGLFACADAPEEESAPESGLTVPRDQVTDDTKYASLREQGKADFLGLWPNVSMEHSGSGRDLTDGADCHTESTRLWDCSRGDGKISFSQCSGGTTLLGRSLYNAMADFMGMCIERAVGRAGDSTDFKRAHIYSGGGIVNDRATRGGGWRSLHSWGRAIDIGNIEITFDDGSTTTYSYLDFARGRTETKSYVFFDRLRDCWGNSVHSWVLNNGSQLLRDNILGSLSCDDDPSGRHCDHMHISVSSAWLTAWCDASYE